MRGTDRLSRSSSRLRRGPTVGRAEDVGAVTPFVPHRDSEGGPTADFDDGARTPILGAVAREEGLVETLPVRRGARILRVVGVGIDTGPLRGHGDIAQDDRRARVDAGD